MSGEPNLNLSVMEVYNAKVCEAESHRWATIAKRYVTNADERGDHKTAAEFRNYVAAAWPSKPEPPPPADEPVTIQGLIGKWKARDDRGMHFWPDVEIGLTGLVEAESKRWADILMDGIRAGLERANDNVVDALRACRKVGLDSQTKPAPPAAVSNANWDTIRNDLQALVQERARRDAEIVRNSSECDFNEHIANDILKAAGIDA